MTFLPQVSVGGSNAIWRLYREGFYYELTRFNPKTLRYTPIIQKYASPTSATLKFIDAGADGTLWGIAENGDLYRWDEEKYQLILINTTLKPNLVAVGSQNMVWALGADNRAYRWLPGTQNFIPVENNLTFKTLAIGKEDNSVWGIDLAGKLARWDEERQIWEVFNGAGAENLSQLSVISSTLIWALGNDKKLYQWNSEINRFVSVKLPEGDGALNWSQISLAPDGVLYGYAPANFYGEADFQVLNVRPVAMLQNAYTNPFAPAVATDAQGQTQLVWNQNGQVLHSFQNQDGAWVDAGAIPGSKSGENLIIAADQKQFSNSFLGTNNGTILHAAWTEGIGDNAQIHYAKGVPSPFGGFVWTAPRQLTANTVENLTFSLTALPEGGALLTSENENIPESRQQFILGQSAESETFTLLAQPNGTDPQLDTALINSTFEQEFSKVQPNFEVARIWKSKLKKGGTDFDIKQITRYRGGYQYGKQKGHYLALRFEYRYEAKFKFDGGETTFIFYLQAGIDRSIPEGFTHWDGLDVSLTGGMEIKIEIPIYKTVLTTIGITAGGALDLTIKANALSSLMLESLASNPNFLDAISAAVRVVDSSGRPATVQTPPNQLFWSIDFEGLANATPLTQVVNETMTYIGEAADAISGVIDFIGLGGLVSNNTSLEPAVTVELRNNSSVESLENAPNSSEAQIIGDSGVESPVSFLEMSTFIDNIKASARIRPYFGVYAKVEFVLLSWNDEAKVTGRVIGVINFDLYPKTAFKSFDLVYRIDAEVTLSGIWNWRLRTDITFNTSVNSPATPLGAEALTQNIPRRNLESISLMVGETWMDNGSVNKLITANGAVYGTFVQLSEDPQNYSEVYFIQGKIDLADPNKINWDTKTLQKIPNSAGLNLNPLITLDKNNNLVISYGHTSAADPTVKALTEVPPGKLYVIYGGQTFPSERVLDLGELSADNSSSPQGFFLSNNSYLSQIGASVSLLGDINGKGKNDFIFSAPGTQNNRGRVYVVYGETVDQVTNLDQLNENGFPYGFFIDGSTAIGSLHGEFGYSVSKAGDVNGDGAADFLIGAPGFGDGKGTVYLLFGGQPLEILLNNLATISVQVGATGFNADLLSKLGSEFVLSYSGLSPTDDLGAVVSGGYDFNGDGFADIVIASPGADRGNGLISLYLTESVAFKTVSYGGSSYQLKIPTQKRIDFINTLSLDGENSAFILSRSTQLIPDVNSDGLADLLIGSDGAAFVVFGKEDMPPVFDLAILIPTAETPPTAAIKRRATWYSQESRQLFRGPDRAQWRSEPDRFKVILEFEGIDSDGNGILEKDGSVNELSAFAVQVFEGQTLKYENFTDTFPTDFNAFQIRSFFYDIATNQVLASQYNQLDMDATGFRFYGSSFLDPQIVLYSSDLGYYEARTAAGNNQFQVGSLTPYDGLALATETTAPLAVNSAGDVNGDGFNDLIVGYEEPLGSGASYVVFGGESLSSLGGLALAQLDGRNGFKLIGAGGQVSAAGDVNGDGFGDLLVSAPRGNQQSGVTYVVYGSRTVGSSGFLNLADLASPQSALGFKVVDSNPYALSGTALSPAGDLNGDGKGDFFIGAPQAPATFATVSAAVNSAQIQTVTRPLTGSQWTEPSPIANVGGQQPYTLTATNAGTLLTWLEIQEDGAPLTTLWGVFGQGQQWQTPQIIAQTAGSVSDFKTAENALGVLAIWTEGDLETGQTRLQQRRYNPATQTWEIQETLEPTFTPQPTLVHNQYYGLAIPGAGGQVSQVYLENAIFAETDAQGEFVVRRQGEENVPLTLRYFTRDLTASAGSDYFHEEGTLTFEAGETEKRVSVRIQDDDLSEHETETFRLYLASDHPQAYLTLAGLPLEEHPEIWAQGTIGDNEPVKLAAIDSGFNVQGQRNTSLGAALSPGGGNDFAIAAPGYNDGKGRVYLLYGGAGVGLKLQGQDLNRLTASQGVLINGVQTLGLAGTALLWNEIVDFVPPGFVRKQQFLIISAPGSPSTPTQQGKVYLLNKADLQGKGSLDLSANNAIVLKLGGTGANSLGTVMALGDLDGNGKADLVVGDPRNNKVYIVYDQVFNQSKGEIDLNNQSYVAVISGSLGALGSGLALVDLNGDGKLDLAIGAPFSNAIEQDGVNKGYGGQVYVIWGTGSRFGNLNLNALGSKGMVFQGQAILTPSEVTDPDGTPPDYGYVDQVGGALAAVDVNQDGIQDLVIGAPQASFDNLSGAGRVYVALGSQTKWNTSSYNLADLYNQPQSGLIFEGAVSGGGAGQTVAAAGDLNRDGYQDLAIGAPLALGNAGEAYAVFASANAYNNLRVGQNVFALDPTLPDTRVAAYQGDPNASNTGQVGGALAGNLDVNGDQALPTGGQDLLIGAPATDIDGNSQTYVAYGHPWVKPGFTLGVSDLRADNGFVLLGGGQSLGVGDFNLDGYDDFIQLKFNPQNAAVIPELILGASPLASADQDRISYRLDKLPVFLPAVSRYATPLATGDFNGDGYPDPAALSGKPDGNGNRDGLTVLYGGENIEAQMQAPQTITGWAYGKFHGTQLATGDWNGDGYDDLFALDSANQLYGLSGSSSGFKPYTDNFFSTILASPEAFYPKEEISQNPNSGQFYLHLLDFNGDGKDELVFLNIFFTNYNEVNAQIKVFTYDVGLGDLVLLHSQRLGNIYNKKAYVNPRDPLNARLSSGDFNGDGKEDLLIDYILGGNSLKDQFFYTTKILFGTDDFSQYFKETAIGQNNSKDLNLNANSFSQSAGDINADGYDDIILGQTIPGKYNYALLGNPQLSDKLTEPIILTPQNNDPKFDHGFAIEGFTNLSQPYWLGAGGDINGDGFDDWLMANIDQNPNQIGNLTYAIYGKNFVPKNPFNPNTILDIQGTYADDVIKQIGSGGKDIVNINGQDGDDFIQIAKGNPTTPFKVHVQGGAGNDTIGLQFLDSNFIFKVDGGSGLDTVFLDLNQQARERSLNLTQINVVNVEIIDLNYGNTLVFGAKDILRLSPQTHTLILKSAGDSVASPIVNPEDPTENLNERPWRKVGENAYEGEIYEVYQPIFDTNAFVWIQKGKIDWRPQEIQTLPAQTLPLALRGQPFGFTAPLDVLSNLDPETRRLTAELASGAPLPGWLEFDPASGTFAGALPEGSLGDWSIRLLARDDDQVQAQTFNLSVKNPVDVPSAGGIIFGTEGNDYISAAGQSGYYRLEGLDGMDVLVGSEQRDLLLGDDGNDQLFGQGSTDQLVGGLGDDLLDGGAGLDYLYGGSGADSFVLWAGDGPDQVMDFSAAEGDLFLLDSLPFGALSFEGNQIFVGAEPLAAAVDQSGNPVTGLADNPQWFVSI